MEVTPGPSPLNPRSILSSDHVFLRVRVRSIDPQHTCVHANTHVTRVHTPVCTRMHMHTTHMHAHTCTHAHTCFKTRSGSLLQRVGLPTPAAPTPADAVFPLRSFFHTTRVPDRSRTPLSDSCPLSPVALPQSRSRAESQGRRASLAAVQAVTVRGPRTDGDTGYAISISIV